MIMLEETILKNLTNMMLEIPVWFVGIDDYDPVNNGGYHEIISVHATEEDAKKALSNLVIDDDRTTVHETTLFEVVREMAWDEHVAGMRWQEKYDAKRIQYYKEKAEQAEQKIKAELLKKLTETLK